MSFTNPNEMGVIACPGGEAFANEVIPILRNLYTRNYERKANELAKKHKLGKDEIKSEMSLTRDLLSNHLDTRVSPDAYEPPKIRIPVEFTKFANGEFKSQIMSSVRDMDLYIFQDMENSYPYKFENSNEECVMSVNDHLLCLFVTIDAAMQSNARSVTLVLPAYPYSRQHKRKGREALTAAWFGRMCENMGVRRILTLDIHSTEISNCFHKINLENLHASYQILKKLSEIYDLTEDNLVVVSPDTGAVDRNKFYAGNLQAPLAMLYKERDYSKVSKNATDNNIKSARLLGDVNGKDVFMADDMLGTGGTLIKAMQLLKGEGAKRIVCAISLPLFSGNAIEAFDEAYEKGYFDAIIGTNAVYHDERLLSKPWYVQANIAQLFAHFMLRLHHGRSTSPLLDNRKIIYKLLHPKD